MSLSCTTKKRLIDCRLRLKCDGTRAETRFDLSAKRTSPFKSVGASVQSTAGSQGVRISGSNAGYTMFPSSVKVLATHSICLFPLHFLSHASQCAIRFQLDSSHDQQQGVLKNTNRTYNKLCFLSILGDTLWMVVNTTDTCW